MSRLNLFIASILVCTGMSGAAELSAQRMLQVAPDDCFALAVTSGSDELKPAFDATIIGKIWNDPQTKNFIESIKHEIIKKVSAEEPNAPEQINLAFEIISLVGERPAIAGAAMKTGSKPVLGFFIADTNTASRARISALLAKLEERCKNDLKDVKAAGYKLRAIKDDDGVPLYWGFAGRYFVCLVNDANGQALKYLSTPRKAVPASLKGVYQSGDALGIYINTERIGALCKTLSGGNGENKEYQTARRVVNELGLSNVDSICWRIGFAGANLTANSLVSIKPGSPRTGLLTCLKPADLAMFNIVDANAMVAAVWNFDLAGAYDTVMNAIKTADANTYASANKAIAQAQATIKFNIRNDLLASIAGPATLYIMPASPENPAQGVVMVARLTDSAKFEKAMNSLGELLAPMSNGMMQNSVEPQPDGRTLHRWTFMPLAMMQISPCWTAADKTFVFATNPSLCGSAGIAAASKQLGPGAFSQTATYKKAAATFPKDVLSVKYVNSRVQFMQVMNKLQQFWPLLTMNMSKGDIVLPAALPDLASYAMQMKPTWEFSWFDNKGLQRQYNGPGPDLGSGGVAGGAMAMAILMPALNKVRHIAYRMVSGSNLSAVGKAMTAYANDHNDTYPPDLETLVTKEGLSPKTLETKQKPNNFKGPCYIYIPGQTPHSPMNNVLVYENPSFEEEGTNVLYNDTHVAFEKKKDFQEAVKRTYKNLGKVPPEGL